MAKFLIAASARTILHPMDTIDTSLAADRRSETEAERQQRLAQEADARHTGGDDWRMRLTLEGLADIDAGRLIDDEAMKAWADSLGSDNELPVPQPN